MVIDVLVTVRVAHISVYGDMSIWLRQMLRAAHCWFSYLRGLTCAIGHMRPRVPESRNLGLYDRKLVGTTFIFYYYFDKC